MPGQSYENIVAMMQQVTRAHGTPVFGVNYHVTGAPGPSFSAYCGVLLQPG